MSGDDRHRAFELVASLCDSPDLYVVVAPGDPASKHRPRVGKGGNVYTPAATRSAEDALAYRLLRLPTFAGNVAVACVFYRSNKQRIDIDNLTKLVLDAATKGRMWEDDSQVTALLAVLEHDAENPRTVVAFGNAVSSMTRGEAAQVPCEKCGRLFLPIGTKTKHCSRECRLLDPVECQTCGRSFRRRTFTQKFCSAACRGAAQSKRFAARTHCRRGHMLDDGNVRQLEDGRRRCLACQAENAHTYRRNKQLRLEQASVDATHKKEAAA